MPYPKFSPELLLKLKLMFTYDPEIGEFRRRDGRNRNRPLKNPEKTAKTYKQINANGDIHYAHTMAWWFLTDGPVPEGMEIDHKNRDKRDNRRDNLRVVTRGRNVNNRTMNSNNTSGIAGVWWNSSNRRWSAAIRVDGVTHGLGHHETHAEAVQARLAGELKHLGEIASRHITGPLPDPVTHRPEARAPRPPDQRKTKTYARDIMERRVASSKSLHPGIVRLSTGRYQARFRNRVLGSYDLLEEAVECRQAAVAKYFEE